VLLISSCTCQSRHPELEYRLVCRRHLCRHHLPGGHPVRVAGQESGDAVLRHHYPDRGDCAASQYGEHYRRGERLDCGDLWE